MNIKALVFLFFIISVELLSCKNKDIPPPAAPSAGLIVVNGTGDTLNYYLHGTRQNNTSFIYPGGATVYTAAEAGAQNYSFEKEARPQVLFNAAFTLDSGQFYSMFVAEPSAAYTFLIPDLINVAGNEVSDTTAAIRFVNASPNAGTLSFTINTGDTVSFKNSAFKSYSPFMPVQIIADTIKVYQNGGAKPVVDTAVLLEASTIYTVFTYTKGASNTGNTAFHISLITNIN
jgi:hypothetical protein